MLQFLHITLQSHTDIQFLHTHIRRITEAQSKLQKVTVQRTVPNNNP